MQERDCAQFKMKIPQDLKRWIAVEAAKNMRTQSSQITFILREAMATANRGAKESVRAKKENANG